MSASVPVRSWRGWVVLGVVTMLALLLLWWAVSKPAVCAIDASPAISCTQQARMLPATLGLVVTLALAVATAIVAAVAPVAARARILGVGAGLTGAAGVVFVVATLFSAGFSIP